MKEGFDFDGALKELFQQDHPTLLDEITGGVAIQEFLNVELPKVQERRVDLVLLLVDRTILHIEFQSANQKDIPYRVGIYCLLLGQRYRRPVRQVVLYVGQPKMRMPDHLDLGQTRVGYRLMDIREIDAGALLRTGRPADLVLAILAGGGEARLREIVEHIARLKGPERDRALAQLLVLSGLRALPRRVELEMSRMGVVIDVSKNPVLMKWRREAIEEGRREGLQEGLQEGRREGLQEGVETVLRDLLEARFGRLPKWAGERVTKASITQLERWAKKVMTAETLEDILGKK